MREALSKIITTKPSSAGFPSIRPFSANKRASVRTGPVLDTPQSTTLDTGKVSEVTSQFEVVHCPPGIPNLAPMIVRQRMVIEGTCPTPITEEQIRTYLRVLSDVCGMRLLAEPVTHRSEQYGWAGWVHWESSGAHFYAWDRPMLFFSVDIYTCKEFDVTNACKFTRIFFEAQQLVAAVF
jgi:hypothetical protein